MYKMESQINPRGKHSPDGLPAPGKTTFGATYIRCPRCQNDFRSPLQFNTLAELDRAAQTGIVAQCPHCYGILECYGSNMYCELSPSDEPSVSPMPATPGRAYE
jgi:hypothetical protein